MLPELLAPVPSHLGLRAEIDAVPLPRVNDPDAGGRKEGRQGVARILVEFLHERVIQLHDPNPIGRAFPHKRLEIETGYELLPLTSKSCLFPPPLLRKRKRSQVRPLDG